jgi:PKD repeat protein
MSPFRAPLPWAICLCTIVLAGCVDDSQSPASRPEPPQDQGGPAGSMLRPVDLVYVCGNKFLATNATPRAVHVVYHVVGTEERGSLDLRPGRMEQDQAHSETELQTVEKGTVELWVNDERVTRRPNEGRTCGAPARSIAFDVAGDPATVGSWAPPVTGNPIINLHLSLLPDGRVLGWGHAGMPQIWDPATGNFTAVPSPSLLFCSGQTFLADGRLLVTGGHLSDDHGIPDINLFSSGSSSWSTSTPMARGRWYPTNTMLANGDVVIMAGADENGLTVPLPEIWSRGSVRQLTGASRLFPYYPRTFLAQDGRIYYAGEEQTTRWLDPTGVGSWTTSSNRQYGIRDYGAAVMYLPDKILYVGGGRTTNTAEIADIHSGSPTWQYTGAMQYARRHLNATLLPTGEVLVTGGVSGTGFNDVTTTAVHAAEVWDPKSGAWTTLSSDVKNRGYHATSILLPDGRVLHTGAGDGANAPNENSYEIFSPPYLFKGSRPTISSVPSIVGYGTPFTITTPDAASIDSVSLIRIGSTTHAFDANQRFQWLSFTRGSGSLSVTVPTNHNVTPPGHYLVFILDGNLVPSMGKIIRVGTDADLDPPSNQPPAADFTSSCTGLGCNFTDQSFDPDGTVTGWSWTFGDGGTSGAQNPSRTYASAGTYTVTLTVTDNQGATQQRTSSVSVGTSAISLSVTGSTDATKQYMTLKWTGATGSTVDVYRDGTFIKNVTNNGKYVNSRSLPGSPSYTYKVCLVGSTTNCSNNAVVTFGGGPPPNQPPVPDFTSSCNGLACTFTDRSTDPDGTVTGWSWTFGDGGLASVQNPSHTYAASGTYTVKLTATDNGGSAVQKTGSVTVSTTQGSSIVLSVSGRTDATTQYMTLTWTGATGATVDVYRNGTFLKNVTNNGKYTNSRPLPGSPSYTYKVCLVGTSTCSNNATVNF